MMHMERCAESPLFPLSTDSTCYAEPNRMCARRVFLNAASNDNTASYHRVATHSCIEPAPLAKSFHASNHRVLVPVQYPTVNRPMVSITPGSQPMMSNIPGSPPGMPMTCQTSRPLLPIQPRPSNQMVQVHSAPESRSMIPIASTSVVIPVEIPVMSHYPTVNTATAFGCSRMAPSNAYFDQFSSLNSVPAYQYAPIAYSEYKVQASDCDCHSTPLLMMVRMEELKHCERHEDEWSLQTEYEDMDFTNIASEDSIDSQNSSATLPQRRGVGICKYFVKHGICSFGARCIFDHPLDTVPSHPIMPHAGSPTWRSVVESPCSAPASLDAECAPFFVCRKQIPSEAASPDFSPVGNAQVTYNSHGYPSRPGAEACSFYQRTGECQYSRTCKYDHPEHIGILEERVPIAGFNAQNLPLRPEAQHCVYFTKTGHCRFGSTCKWNHPELSEGEREGLFEISSKLNGKGYPLRQGANTCTFYKQRGYCSYGAACKFDHPMD